MQKDFGDETHKYRVLANPDFTTNTKKPWASFYNGQPLELHRNYDEAVDHVNTHYRTQTLGISER